MNQKYKKEDRIRKRYEFITLSELGLRYFFKNIIVIFRENQLKKSRLGITVSKKVGNAVERNRKKRIIREFFRKSREEINKNYDINVIVRKKNKNCDEKDIKEELLNFITAIGKNYQ